MSTMRSHHSRSNSSLSGKDEIDLRLPRIAHQETDMALPTPALVVILLLFLALLILLLLSPFIVPDKTVRQARGRHIFRPKKRADLEAGALFLRRGHQPSLQERLSAGRDAHALRLARMDDALLEQPKRVHVPRSRVQEQEQERTELPKGFAPDSFRARARRDARFATGKGPWRAPPRTTI